MTELHNRKSMRLKEYDYSSNGAYFITLCVEGKRKLLGSIAVGANCVRPSLSNIGKIVEKEIDILSKTYDGISVDKYVIMPNHIHMILTIDQEGGRTQFAPTVSRIVKQFKGSITKQIGESIWQRSFYDHVIRDDADYFNKWNYIDTNPVRWIEDEYYAL